MEFDNPLGKIPDNRFDTPAGVGIERKMKTHVQPGTIVTRKLTTVDGEVTMQSTPFRTVFTMIGAKEEKVERYVEVDWYARVSFAPSEYGGAAGFFQSTQLENGLTLDRSVYGDSYPAAQWFRSVDGVVAYSHFAIKRLTIAHGDGAPPDPANFGSSLAVVYFPAQHTFYSSGFMTAARFKLASTVPTQVKKRNSVIAFKAPTESLLIDSGVVSPFDALVVLGQPWHGVFHDGHLETDNGVVRSEFYTPYLPYYGQLIDFGMPDAPAPTPAEAAQGMQFKNYALLCGYHQWYSPPNGAGAAGSTSANQAWYVNALPGGHPFGMSVNWFFDAGVFYYTVTKASVTLQVGVIPQVTDPVDMSVIFANPAGVDVMGVTMFSITGQHNLSFFQSPDGNKAFVGNLNGGVELTIVPTGGGGFTIAHRDVTELTSAFGFSFSYTLSGTYPSGGMSYAYPGCTFHSSFSRSYPTGVHFSLDGVLYVEKIEWSTTLDVVATTPSVPYASVITTDARIDGSISIGTHVEARSRHYGGVGYAMLPRTSDGAYIIAGPSVPGDYVLAAPYAAAYAANDAGTDSSPFDDLTDPIYIHQANNQLTFIYHRPAPSYPYKLVAAVAYGQTVVLPDLDYTLSDLTGPYNPKTGVYLPASPTKGFI